MPQSNESLLNNLAHELRQPLSTIESIAYYLELALPHSDPRVLEQLTRLRHLVEQSGWILNDALSLSQPKFVHPEAVDLDEILSEFVLEQAQQDSHWPHFDLELSGAPVWMDFQQARELVQGICRFFRAVAKAGSEIRVDTRVLAGGSVLLRARAEGQSGDDASLPPGSNLTLEWMEQIAAQNSATLVIQLLDPARLELTVEVPPARLEHSEFPEFEEAGASFGVAEQPEPVVQGTL
jgi:signal transduction histidine kinase